MIDFVMVKKVLKDCSPREVSVYIALLTFNGRGCCFPSRKTIAKMLNIRNPNMISRVLKSLEVKGFIKRDFRVGSSSIIKILKKDSNADQKTEMHENIGTIDIETEPDLQDMESLSLDKKKIVKPETSRRNLSGKDVLLTLDRMKAVPSQRRGIPYNMEEVCSKLAEGDYLPGAYINENINEEINENLINKKSPKFFYSNSVNNKNQNMHFDEETKQYQLSKLFYSLMLRNDPNTSMPDFQKWNKEIDEINKKDSRDWSEIENVIKWALEDKFWMSIIINPKKLRQNFTQLKLKMETNNGKSPRFKTSQAQFAKHDKISINSGEESLWARFGL